MGISLGEFFIRWFVTAVAVFAAAWIVPGITYSSFTSLAFASLLLGIINALVRPVLLILCLPLILVTMGLFILVLNALLLWLVSGLMLGGSFQVDGFWSAFWGGIGVGVVSWLLSSFFRGSDGRIYPLTHHTVIKQARGRTLN
jgi:putative membrane protein